jgi:hypothetical protein
VASTRQRKAFEIVKNFPEGDELRDDFHHICEPVSVTQLRHFWAVEGRLRARSTSR